MHLPKKAEDVHAALAAAFNTGDINQVYTIYDYNGIIVPEPGKVVSGKQQFEEAVKAIMAVKGTMEIKTVYCLQTGDVAVGRSEWNITDGDEVKVSAKGIEVMRRQADGSWKVVIDHAFGALDTLKA
ncbi:SgcJ/EcaC family oxidoreductase [Chitinophaga varians]|uniref:SgcJ/EcaC family oxidoreductase n=1 Tax=Chitinophaga varians TaxID=2202339 RepID=A0A847RYY2_9BACT|nr:SgcJ/EcaC family oxidoreductase [Chitinophaga varians]NLR67986.1 SgcJ/EcaC family oxidoreductase [Chitinophaga varians]